MQTQTQWPRDRPRPPDPATVARLRARVRALEANLDLRAERVAAQVWAVPSLSAPGELHVVSRHNGQWTCDCRAADMHRYCAHLAAVDLVEERRRARVQLVAA